MPSSSPRPAVAQEIVPSPQPPTTLQVPPVAVPSPQLRDLLMALASPSRAVSGRRRSKSDCRFE